MNEQLNVLIVDDDRFCINRLSQMLSQYQKINIVGELTDTSSYSEILKKVSPDLVFLDINLGMINGFSIAEFTRKYNPEIMIVFVTGFDDFALDGYEYEPLDFLVKPIDEKRLERTLMRASEKKRYLGDDRKLRIGCQFSTGFQYVIVNNILFIERSVRKVQMKCLTENGIETYVVRKNLSELEKIFGIYGFIRVHQSVLVPLKRITGIYSVEVGYGYELTIEGWPGKLPLSREKYRELKEQIKQRVYI